MAESLEAAFEQVVAVRALALVEVVVGAFAAGMEAYPIA